MPITILRLGQFHELPTKDGLPGVTVNHQLNFHNYGDTNVPTLDCVICDPPLSQDDGAGSVQKQGRWVVSNEGHDGFLLECSTCHNRFDRACFYPREETMIERQVVTEGGGMASEGTVPAQVADHYQWGPFDR